MAKYLDQTDELYARSRHDDPVRVSANEARQGSLGRPVLYVLIAGLLLAMVAWAASELWGGAIAPPRDNTETPAASSTTTTPPVSDTSTRQDTSGAAVTPDNNAATGAAPATTDTTTTNSINATPNSPVEAQPNQARPETGGSGSGADTGGGTATGTAP